MLRAVEERIEKIMSIPLIGSGHSRCCSSLSDTIGASRDVS